MTKQIKITRRTYRTWLLNRAVATQNHELANKAKTAKNAELWDIVFDELHAEIMKEHGGVRPRNICALINKRLDDAGL